MPSMIHRAQSLPGLGKGVNPLRGYLGAPQPLFSAEESEAEQLVYALASQDAFQIYGGQSPQVHKDPM